MRQERTTRLTFALTLVLVLLVGGCATTTTEAPQPPEAEYDDWVHPSEQNAADVPYFPATSQRRIKSVVAAADTATPASHVRVGRYTSADSSPTISEVEPLKAVVHLTFPRSVKTIGQALDYALMRTGYRSARTTSIAQDGFLRLPLPEQQRTLGPYSVDQILAVLLGTEWRLNIDHATRVVGFVPSPAAHGTTSVEVKGQQPVAAAEALKGGDVVRQTAQEATP